jgi:hypothetical protein
VVCKLFAADKFPAPTSPRKAPASGTDETPAIRIANAN